MLTDAFAKQGKTGGLAVPSQAWVQPSRLHMASLCWGPREGWA